MRQPEYTGANRWLPCTIANGFIALTVSALVAVGASAGVAAVVLAVCGAAIYLRGYLIPGTPTLTKRYLPDRVHRLLGTHHVPPEGDGAASPSGDPGVADAERASTNAEEALRADGAVTECPNADDICLDPEFRDAWRNRITGLREGETGVERLAAHLDVDPEALALEDRGREYAMTYEGDRVDGWPSRAAFLADMGVEPTLAEWCSDWESYDAELRTRIIASLRAFLERCPACDAELEAAESTWETCCREGTDVTVRCDRCESVVFNGRY
jgi:hypothetical protein